MCKIKRLIVFIGSLFILTSCTDAKIVVPIQEYNELQPEVEIGEGKDEKDKKDDDRNIPEKPNQEIAVYSRTDVVGAYETALCWNESVEEDCILKPEHPRERSSTELPLSANRGEKLEIRIFPGGQELPDFAGPYKVEVTEFGLGDNDGKIINSKLVEHDITFSAPDKKGAHYYLIHIIWNEEQTKRVYYAFRTVVR
ncbi:hypothetical protein ACFFIS_17045 [Virgibacillus soli]|uniref:Lipoprotein n=1 Tax=Paracerasibacillus soli TaxID=480284 RepID=A0ABU5CRN1_9BACI|nr:hypothetical protein [Virgibacillus soli]MDY0408999.1 hypothetical protein [Virgibacillus soli]